MSVEPDHLLRVMVLPEQRLLAEMVDLTLNHGVYVMRTARVLVITRRSLRETEKWLEEAPVH